MWAYRRAHRTALGAEAALCAAAALPPALLAGAVVRAYQLRAWEQNALEPVTLPWDAGLVAPWLSAAGSALALGTMLVWLRRARLAPLA